MRIAIDAMGGDHAPAEIVAGCLAAAAAFPDTELTLVGDPAAIAPLLGVSRPANLDIVPATEQIGMDEDPARAVRRKRDSSLVVGCRLVAEGHAQAVFSAGNTGALSTAATFVIGRIEGVDRPCIAAIMPSSSGRVVICDAGASVDSKPRWIHQFGIMGAVYAEEVEGIRAPRIGLINIGEESSKGNAQSKATFSLFEESDLNFVGNIEGKDTFRGVVDVIACDGFSGNLVLKVAEGAAEFFVSLTRQALQQSWRTKLGAWLCLPGFRRLKETVDYAEYGGAFLLGVKGLVVIGHGRSSSRAVFSAIRRAREGIRHNVVERLAARFADGQPARPAEPVLEER